MSLPESDKLFFNAISAYQRGDITAAADLLLDLVEKYPHYGKGHSYLGLLYFQFFKDPANAEVSFKSGASSSPEFTENYLFYADLLLSQERFAEMNAHLNKVSEIPGVKKNKVYELFGKMNELMEKYDEAIDYYKKAIRFTFSDEEIVSYEKSIARCGIKKKYMP